MEPPLQFKKLYVCNQDVSRIKRLDYRTYSKKSLYYLGWEKAHLEYTLHQNHGLKAVGRRIY